MRYPVFLKQRDGEYWAVVPLLPSCTAQGRTREEVLHNVMTWYTLDSDHVTLHQ